MVRILLRFSEEIIDKPITAQTILEEGVTLNILSAFVTAKGGEILVDAPRIHAEKVIKAMRKKGVVVTIPRQIEVNKDECIDCGACVSLCPVGVISLMDDYSVAFNEEKCLGNTCGLCIDACPVRALHLIR